MPGFRFDGTALFLVMGAKATLCWSFIAPRVMGEKRMSVASAMGIAMVSCDELMNSYDDFLEGERFRTCC